MNERIQHLLEQAQELPEKDRAELAAELLNSLQPARSEWEEEIASRVAAYDNGLLSSESVEEVLGQARRALKS